MLDTLLYNGLQARDRKALETLYDRHAAMVWQFAVTIAGREDWAEQSLEAAFVAVWKTPGTEPSSLIQRLLRTCLLDLRQRPIPPARIGPAALSQAAARMVLQGVALDHVAAALLLPDLDIRLALRNSLSRAALLSPQTSTIDFV
jgi:DNA-directed RNA polymerase specialized sigma24 family protein